MGFRILYIETDKALREKTTEEMESRGHQVFAKDSLDGDLKTLTENQIEIILCNQELPEEIGFACLKSIREQGLNIPFVLTTTNCSAETAKKAIQAGAFILLVKPININELESVIHQAMEYSKLQQKIKSVESDVREEMLHKMIEVSPIPMIISRMSDGTILYVNDSLQNVLRYGSENVVGRSTLEFYENPDDRQIVLKGLREKGFVSNLEIKIKRGDGSIAWTVFSISTTEFKGEQVIVGGLYEISDRKEAEEALRKSEHRFRGLVENANDIIFSLDAGGNLNYLSPQITKILGWKPSEFIGKPVWEMIIPEDAQITKEWVNSGYKDTGWRYVDGFRLAHKDGGWKWFTSDASVIRKEDGSVEEVIGIAHDITEIRKLFSDLRKTNAELRNTQSQLLQSEKMAALGQLVAGIAHEINTPMGAIGSMHDTLVRGLEKLKKTINSLSFDENTLNTVNNVFATIDDSNKVIKSGTARVSEIVRRLRSFARLDEAELKTVDIHDGIEDTITLVHHELKHDIEVIRNFGQIDHIACFPGQLNQVFLNLIVNARHAIKGKGQITISTRQEGDKVIIDISDTGVGIPKESLKKIFDPGFTTKGVGVGTGLGLSICYQIVKTHRGEIKAESEVGKGTTFTVIIPKDLDKIIENT